MVAVSETLIGMTMSIGANRKKTTISPKTASVRYAGSRHRLVTPLPLRLGLEHRGQPRHAGGERQDDERRQEQDQCDGTAEPPLHADIDEVHGYLTQHGIG